MFKKKFFDKNILIKSRFNDIKVTQSIKTTTSGNQELAHKKKEFEEILPRHFFANHWQVSVL